MNIFHRSFITAVFAAGVILISQALGDINTELPETPAGQKIKELLAVIESGDANQMRAFVEGFTKSLERFSVEEHVDFFMQIYTHHGGFEIVKIEMSTDNEIEVLLKGKKSREYRYLKLMTEKHSPYAIENMSFEMAVDPSKIPPPPSASEAADPKAVIKGKMGAAIDKYMIQAMQSGFSGTVLVAEKGEKILHKGYGWAVREPRIPVSTQTVFDIGSISKPFTAAAVMKLEQQGKLKIADPITKFFDDVPKDKKDITIHHLLTHSAGLLEYHDTEGDFEEMTREEAVQRILSQKLKFKPGEKHAYSNSGFTLLAAIVEKVSGKPFQEYLKEELLEPAGMSSTGFYRNPAWKEKNVAHGYNALKFGKQNSPLAWPLVTWALLGGGGMVSSAEDLYRWHLAMEGNDILSAEAKKKSYTGHITIDDQAMMGLGWGIRKTDRGTKMISHGGANDFGFRAYFIRYLDDDVVVIITSNSGRAGNVRDLHRHIANLIFKRK